MYQVKRFTEPHKIWEHDKVVGNYKTLSEAQEVKRMEDRTAVYKCYILDADKQSWSRNNRKIWEKKMGFSMDTPLGEVFKIFDRI